MSTPSPRKPSKVTTHVNSDAHTIDVTVDIYETRTGTSEGVKAFLERRKRERREARERAAGQTPPSDPPQENKPTE